MRPLEDTPMIEWQPRAKAYAQQLADSGAITDPAWLEAFEQTPRHLFVPRFWALDEFNAPHHVVDGANPDQREEWLGAVYSDQFLATQVKDGIITSSASQPSLVATMLELLDAEPGCRVLEIGTGTGYNTALLCHRVGDRNVASVDIDGDLVAEADALLAELGQRPDLVTTDGATGLPGGPHGSGHRYHRIIATCASPGVPAAWIEQLADGGRIVAPFTFGGALAVVTKTGPTEVQGHFAAEPAWFMPLRPDAHLPMPSGHLINLPDHPPADAAHIGTTDVNADIYDPDFRLWLVLHLPGARLVDWVDDATHRRTGQVIHTATHIAVAEFETDDGTPRVTQDDRRLWDTVEAAWRSWQDHDRPARTRLGITARTGGTQRAWLDTPASRISWPVGC